MNDKIVAKHFRDLAVQHARIAETYQRLANELASGSSGGAREPAPPPTGALSRVSLDMPVKDRELRQALVVKAILDQGGKVPHNNFVDVNGVSRHQGDFVEIANRYGYYERGLAGFFRGADNGLLRTVNGKVSVTPHGRERLKANLARVEEFLASQAA